MCAAEIAGTPVNHHSKRVVPKRGNSRPLHNEGVRDQFPVHARQFRNRKIPGDREIRKPSQYPYSTPKFVQLLIVVAPYFIQINFHGRHLRIHLA